LPAHLTRRRRSLGRLDEISRSSPAGQIVLHSDWEDDMALAEPRLGGSPAEAGSGVARALNILLGVWLFLSAFLWQHTDAQRSNTWICGVLCVAFALVALGVGVVRYLNTLLAIWIFISAFALPSISVGTVWNNALVAVAMFVLSLVPTTASERFRVPRGPQTV
jgi:hypothetical protein